MDIISVYQEKKTIKGTAKTLKISESKVKKELISAGLISTPISQRVARLAALGYPVAAIAKQTGLSHKTVNVNMPYSRCRYKNK